jgi:cardiolipin synthase A/B
MSPVDAPDTPGLELIPLLYIAAEWIIRIVMIPVVIRKRRPAAAMAWLAIIFFIPLIGFIAYLLIGEVRLGKKRFQRHARLREEVEQRAPAVCPDDSDAAPDVPPQHDDLARLARTMGHFAPVGGNAVELMPHTEEKIDRLVADIDAAQHHVHMVYYIFRPDGTGSRVAEALIRAAGRGVVCRVLADASGSKALFGALAGRMRAAGVDIRPALPVNPFRLALSRMDLRNHRKLAVVDQAVAHTGSQNIVDADYGQKRYGAWQDLSIRLRGPAVAQLQTVFLEDWYAETGVCLDEPQLLAIPAAEGKTTVQTIPSGPAYPVESFEPLMVAALHEAERRIVMTSPYFVPTESLILALRIAVLRGIEVDVVVPERSNHRLAHAAACAYFDDMLAAGVRLHLHRRGLLHAKTLTVDDSLALIGSANLDIRSFQINFELNLLLFGAQVVAQLRRQQGVYIAQSRPLDADAWHARSRPRRLAENTARLFSPLL